jgi:hypothetical protein
MTSPKAGVAAGVEDSGEVAVAEHDPVEVESVVVPGRVAAPSVVGGLDLAEDLWVAARGREVARWVEEPDRAVDPVAVHGRTSAVHPALAGLGPAGAIFPTSELETGHQ